MWVFVTAVTKWNLRTVVRLNRGLGQPSELELEVPMPNLLWDVGGATQIPGTPCRTHGGQSHNTRPQ
jgi:hypothetical protein